MAKRKNKMPKEIMLYKEQDGDTWYFLAATDIDEIPESHSGKFVGVYTLTKKFMFTVNRELK